MAARWLWNGREVEIANPSAARALGIAMVFQHFSLFDTLTVTENIALGLPADTDLAELAQRIEETAREYGLELEPQRHVHTLSVGECQRVEIVRALLAKPQLLILDEPTSVLTPAAVEKLFDTLRLLAAQGCSILYISHKLDEIRALCHTCTVVRAGKNVGVCDPSQETSASLSRMMIGAEPPAVTRQASAPGAAMLSVKQFEFAQKPSVRHRAARYRFRGARRRDRRHRRRVRQWPAGIIGRAVGRGHARAAGRRSGSVRSRPDACRPASAVRSVSASCRKSGWGAGAVPDMSLADNILLSLQTPATIRHGFLRRNAIVQRASDIIARFQVKAGGPQALARSLSGGNLQKYIVGREVLRQPTVLVVAQPTWGVDVGAAAQIRAELLALRDAGCALLVVSEELDELFEISDRLLVMAKGKLSPSLDVKDASVTLVGEWMSGLWPQAQEAAHG